MSQTARAEFMEQMEETLFKAYGLGFNYANQWERVYRIEDSQKMAEEIEEFVHPSVVVQTDEGSPLARLPIRKAYLTRVVHLTFTGEVKITWEFIRDNKYREIEKNIWGLGNAIQRKIYKDAMALFYNGFSSVTVPDGSGTPAALYGTHNLKFATGSVTTDSNGSTAALNSDNFNTAVTDMLETLDENGDVNPFGMGKLQLIVPPKLKKQALQIIHSPYEADTMNNAINVFNGATKDGWDVEVVCLPLLIETTQAYKNTQWYLRDPAMAEDYYFWRERPDTWMVNDINSLGVLYQCKVAYSFMIPTWRGKWGSKGQ